MTDAETERAAVVAWLEAQGNRGDLKGALCLRERLILAWHSLRKPEAVYRGAARYFGERLSRGEHLAKEQGNG